MVRAGRGVLAATSRFCEQAELSENTETSNKSREKRMVEVGLENT
jgi:hypothetical protein